MNFQENVVTIATSIIGAIRREVGGTCEKCDCNGNIDFRVPESCDPESGKCLKCLYHTTGFQCEHCEDDYFGDATKQQCQRLVFLSDLQVILNFVNDYF